MMSSNFVPAARARIWTSFHLFNAEFGREAEVGGPQLIQRTRSTLGFAAKITAGTAEHCQSPSLKPQVSRELPLQRTLRVVHRQSPWSTSLRDPVQLPSWRTQGRHRNGSPAFSLDHQDLMNTPPPPIVRSSSDPSGLTHRLGSAQLRNFAALALSPHDWLLLVLDRSNCLIVGPLPAGLPSCSQVVGHS